MNGSRKLTIKELFDIFQLEYVCAMLRYTISKRNKDKIFWNKIMLYKEKHIKDISIKNNFYSIFDDEKILEQYKKKIVPDFGIPNFIYRDEKNKIEQQEWDFTNFYTANTQVVYKGDNYVIKSFNFINNTITFDVNSEELSFHINEISCKICF